MITEANRKMAQYAVKEATRHHTAFKKWFDWCDGLSAAKKAAGLFKDDVDYGSPAWVERSAAVEREYALTHKKPPMPLDIRKYRMYEATYRAANLAGVEIPNGAISNMDGVFRTLAAVTAVLALS